MPLFQLILVALIQGLTEFLPVSSSGHLILLPNLTGMQDQGVVIDVAVHVGTLGAVVIYFRQDVALALSGCADILRRRTGTPGARLAWLLAVATVPVMSAGLVIHATGLGAAMRSVAVIGWTMLVFGIVLWWADRTGPQIRTAEDWTLRHAVIMGLWQALALIPGTSRSGITITAGRQLGYTREQAARLAMLMSIPTIIASGAVQALDVALAADSGLARDAVIAGAMALGAALLALAVMMPLTRRISFTPYVIYRVILGVILLAIAYG